MTSTPSVNAREFVNQRLLELAKVDMITQTTLANCRENGLAKAQTSKKDSITALVLGSMINTGCSDTSRFRLPHHPQSRLVIFCLYASISSCPQPSPQDSHHHFHPKHQLTNSTPTPKWPTSLCPAQRRASQQRQPC